jgi:hypothetical protein
MGSCEEGEAAEREAAREARDCGDIEITGILYGMEDELVILELDSRKSRTSLCDWRVMRTDSAEVMQPLTSIGRRLRTES